MAELADAYMLLHQGAQTLSQIESNGIKVDLTYLKKTTDEITQRIKVATEALKQDTIYKTWRKRYGDKTKLGSRAQLSHVLFDILKYPNAGYTEASKDLDEEDRRYRADVDAFSHLDVQFVKDFIRLEKLKKLLGTYLKGITDEVIDGYVHPFFNLHTVITYRSSSDSPNFHNFPMRDPEIARIIRQCFIPRKGRVLVEIDFSGIEVRVACCYTKDPQLIKEFTGPGGDPHGATAMQLFTLPKEMVEKRTTRDWAKNRFVFPQFYGSVAFQCAPALWQAFGDGKLKLPDGKSILKHMKEQGIKELGDCDPKARPTPGTFVYHVQKVEQDFWQNRFKIYTAWKEKWYRDYLKTGGFTTLTGFRFDMILRKNQVLNIPIQGTAFHWLLWFLNKFQKRLNRYKMKSKIVGQIHDSALGDVPTSELQDYISMAWQIITEELPKFWHWIIVPVEVEVEVAEGNWYNKGQWIKNESGIWAPKPKG